MRASSIIQSKTPRLDPADRTLPIGTDDDIQGALAALAVMSECAACRRVFPSVELFDAHRVGSYARNTRHCTAV